MHRGRDLDPPSPTYCDGHFSDPSLTVTDTVGTHHLLRQTP
jgi:hypothetical protein